MDNNNLKNLMEAYGAVYYEPAIEVDEEEIWEEVEDWVNSLVEEGYDLSEFSWEDLYEAYLEENAGQFYSKPSSPSGFIGPKRGTSSAGQFYSQQPTKKPTPTGASSGGLDRKYAKNILSRMNGKTISPARPTAASGAATRPPAATRPAAATPARPATATSRPSAPRPAAATPARPAVPQRASSPANATTAQQISGGTKVYDAQRKAGDFKAASETGSKVWAKANPTLANKPKTPNPLMQKTFGYQTGNAPDQNKTKGKTGFGGVIPKNTTKTESSDYMWGSSSRAIEEIANAYNLVYEAKKVDQDEDNDNDFADVKIARLVAAGMSKEEAIEKVKNKSYNEEYELDEAMTSGPRRDKMISKQWNDHTSSRDRANAFNIAVRGDSVSSKPSHRRKSVGGKGERYGDGGAGNKASRRMGNAPVRGNRDPRNEDFELWVSNLLDEGYDLSDYTLDEMFEIYEETAKEKEERIAARRARVREMEAQGRVMTSARRTRERAKERKEEQRAEKLERMANAALDATRGPTRRSSKPMGSVQPQRAAGPGEANRKLSATVKNDTLAANADKILRMLRNEDFQLWLDELVEEGYELDNWTADELVSLYEDICEAVNNI